MDDFRGGKYRDYMGEGKQIRSYGFL